MGGAGETIQGLWGNVRDNIVGLEYTLLVSCVIYILYTQ